MVRFDTMQQKERNAREMSLIFANSLFIKTNFLLWTMMELYLTFRGVILAPYKTQIALVWSIPADVAYCHVAD